MLPLEFANTCEIARWEVIPWARVRIVHVFQLHTLRKFALPIVQQQQQQRLKLKRQQIIHMPDKNTNRVITLNIGSNFLKRNNNKPTQLYEDGAKLEGE